MFSTRTCLLIIVLFIGLDFQNCSSDLDCSSEEVKPFFDIKGLSSIHLGIHKSSALQAVEEKDEIDFELYSYLIVNFDVDFITAVENSSIWNKLEFSTRPKVYGCSIPTGGYKGSKTEGIADLQFITLNDFNEEVMVGDTINDFLEVSSFHDFSNPEKVSNFVDRNKDNIELTFFLVKNIVKPTLSNKLKYKIIIELTNGERYEHETEEIRFKE